MNSLTVKILAALVSILMITTICTQVYHFFRDKHDTEEAVLATVNEDIVFDGIIVRDESVVTYNGGGVLDYKYADGSKVSMNSTIAEVFSDEKAIYARDRIAEIDEEIEQLEKAQDPATTNYVEPEALLSGVRGGYYDLLEAIENRDLEKIPEIRSQIALNSNMYGVITGKEEGFDEAISELKAEREKLQSVAAAPNDVITREEVVQTLNNHMGQPKVKAENPFKDVVKGTWYFDAVLWGNQNGIAVGFGDGYFGIGKTITREQLAQMLYNYATFNEYDLTLEKDAHKGYSDSKTVSGWAVTAMDWAISQGIMSGKGVAGAPKSEIKLDPLAGATRAECASMIMKIDQKNKK